MTLVSPSRRGFLGGLAATLGGLIAAPAIVRAGSLMPISQRALLVPAAGFIAQAEISDSMLYEYWVLMGGSIVKRTARDIMDAPPGVYQPWLPGGVGDSIEFRPVNVERAGLKLTREYLNAVASDGNGWTMPSKSNAFVDAERLRLANERDRLERELRRVQYMAKPRS